MDIIIILIIFAVLISVLLYVSTKKYFGGLSIIEKPRDKSANKEESFEDGVASGASLATGGSRQGYPFTRCRQEKTAETRRVPEEVKRAAQKGLDMLAAGFDGGVKTGWDRARQLARCDYISLDALRVMRAWFARHGPDAKNGGTSYPGYVRWVKDGKVMVADKHNHAKYRGAVAWLIWGGDPAYKWIKGMAF